MGDILDIHNPWRDAIAPACFRQAYFHCEVGKKENGRRIVLHEFPKKELPYSEDMGRRAKVFTVRAYCIQYPYDVVGDGTRLYQRDYRIARNRLIDALETGGPGNLQLPFLPPENVVVARYSLTEEDRFGGYCVFDIEFNEFGVPPQYLTPSVNTSQVLTNAADTVRAQAAAGMAGSTFPTPPPAPAPAPATPSDGGFQE